MKFSLRRMALLLTVTGIIFVNLAIQLARFDSVSVFMNDFRFSPVVESVTQGATEAKMILGVNCESSVNTGYAYVSNVQLFLNSGNSDLGYHLLMSDMGMLGTFSGKTMDATSVVKFQEDQFPLFKEHYGKDPIDYKAYVVVHMVMGNSDMRNILYFTGKLGGVK